MEIRSLPLFFVLTALVVSYFSFSNSATNTLQTSHNSGSQSSGNSTIIGDSLEGWITSMKKESQSYRDKGEYDSAKIVLDDCIEDIWQTPKTTGELKQFGWIYVNRAYLYEQIIGDYLLAKKDYLNALDQFNQCNYEDFYVARFVLQPLGNIYTRLGENEQAIVMLTRFQRICEENDQHEALINSYNDLGRAYMNKAAYSTAIQTLKKGIELGIGDDYNCGLLYSSLAEAYLNSKEFDKGIESGNLSRANFERAINTIQKSDYRYEWTQKYLIGTQMILGELNAVKGNYHQANTLFNRGLAAAKDIYGKKHRKIAKIHLGLAKSFIASGDLNQGIDAYQNVLISILPDFNEDATSENPTVNSFYADITVGEGLIGKSRAAQLLFESTGKIEWLELSLETYLRYFQWEDLLRAEQQDNRSKLLFASEIHQVGEEVLSVLFQLQKDRPENDYSQTAFKIIEQTKGILLSESRADLLKDAELILKYPALQLLDEQKMQLSISRIELTKAELANDSSSVQNYKRKIEILDQNHQLTLFKVKKQFPVYDQLVHQRNDTIDMTALKNYLKQNDADILNYFVGKSKAFLVTGHEGNFQFYKLNREECMNSTAKFLSELQHPLNSNATTYEDVAHSLYQDLLTIVSPTLTSSKWIVLPDSELNNIPFEALIRSKKINSPNFKTLDYLLHAHSISYAPSAKFILKKKTKREDLKPYLGIAPLFKADPNYPWLKNSEAEVLIGEDLVGGKVLLGADATKQSILTEIENYEIIHISTHAGIDTAAANANWMAFHSPTTKSKSHLITPELLQLNLSADLVILNACETANGQFYEGEGMLSMSRGFIHAGADNVLTNLWQVNHESNSVLLTNFYEQVIAHQTPSNALRLAKIEYLKSEQVDAIGAHPYYWAAPILIGSNHDLDTTLLHTSSFLYYGIALGAILLLISLVYVKMRRANK